MTRPKPAKPVRSRRGAPEPYRRESDGRYALSVELPPLAGKRRRRAVYGASPDAVRAAADDLRNAIAAGDAPPDRQTPLATYLERWHDARRPGRPGRVLAPKAWKEYDYQMRRSILPYLGRRPIGKLTVADITKWLVDLAEAGRGARTIQFCHAILRKALADGLLAGAVTRNVATDPNLAVPRRHLPTPWPEETGRAFLAGLLTAKDPDRPLYMVQMMIGTRPAEALSLPWSEVDLTNGTLAVASTLTEWEGERFAKDPKSEAGWRTLPLPAELVEALREHRGRLMLAQAAAGDAWRPNDLVFPNPDGGPRRVDTLSHQFSRKVRRMGLPHIRLYDLRRLAVAMAVSEFGGDQVAAKAFAGHSAIALTAAYSYMLPSVSGPAIERVALRLLHGGKTTPAEGRLAVGLAVNASPTLRSVPDSSTNPVEEWDPSI